MAESKSNAIMVFINPLMMFLAHIIYAWAEVGLFAMLLTLGASVISMGLLYLALFVMKQTYRTRRITYLVLSAACYVVGTICQTQIVIPVAFAGITLMLSLYMDLKLQRECFLVSGLSMIAYYVITAFTAPELMGKIGSLALIYVLFCAISIFTIMGIRRNMRMIQMLDYQAKAAEAANDSKDAFLSNMSHEIRTPMTSIKGMGELLADREVSPIEKEYIAAIQESSDQLLTIIDDILDYSKIDSGTLELAEDKYSFTSVMFNLKNMMSQKLKGSDVSFITEISPDFPRMLRGDSQRIEQLLSNVLGNSVKYTKHGTIYLGVKWIREGDTAQILMEVTDTGKGIPKDKVDGIMEAFSQVAASRDRKKAGTGLGLSIVRSLCKRMGGDAKVISKLGEGTTVRMSLYQKIEDIKPLAVTDNPRAYKVYLYEPKRCYSDLFISACSALGVSVKAIREPAVFAQTARDDENTVLFFDYEKGIGQVRDIESTFKNVTLVGMTDKDCSIEQDDEPGINLFGKPLSVIGIATALRRERMRTPVAAPVEKKRFSAPDVSVCIVDDNEVNLSVAKGMLEKYDMKITGLESGYDCLRHIANGMKYDIIFMDHMMPQMDGVETVERLRRSEKELGLAPNIVVALTANAVNGADKMFLKAGFNDYLSKPISPMELDGMLRRYVPENRRMEKAAEPADGAADKPAQQDNAGAKAQNGKYRYVDVEKGIAGMGDDKEIYLDVLSTAFREGKKQKALIRELYDRHDMPAYIILVHGIKSGMAGVGAMELSAHAKEHEFAGKEGRYDFIDANVSALEKEYSVVLEEIEQILRDEGVLKEDEVTAESGAPYNPQVLKELSAEEKTEIIQRLSLAADALGDFDQERAMAEIESAKEVSAAVEAAVSNAVAQIENLEYDTAAEMLKEVIKILEE